jgi:hypothetical protein
MVCKAVEQCLGNDASGRVAGAKKKYVEGAVISHGGLGLNQKGSTTLPNISKYLDGLMT